MEPVNTNGSSQTQQKARCLISLNNTGLAGDEAHYCVSGLPFCRVLSTSVTDLLHETRNKEVGVECSADLFLSMGGKLGDTHATCFKICGLFTKV